MVKNQKRKRAAAAEKNIQPYAKAWLISVGEKSPISRRPVFLGGGEYSSSWRKISNKPRLL